MLLQILTLLEPRNVLFGEYDEFRLQKHQVTNS